MKLGLLTAPFPELTLEQCADWAAENGFGGIEIACWPSAYVTHALFLVASPNPNLQHAVKRSHVLNGSE